jgi:CheY-like chemotaxis protein
MEGLHVMVIEDDILGREGLAAMLQAWGCRLTLAQGAQAACDLYQADQPPDIIISDFRLGDGIDGIHAVRLVCDTAGRQIAACLITGDTDANIKQQAQAAGLPLLYKPVRPAKLRNWLRHAVLPGSERRRTPR